MNKSQPKPDKRNEPRLITLSPLSLKILQPSQEYVEAIKVLDVSTNGISVMTALPLPVRSEVTVQFETSSFSATLSQCAARVHRCEELSLSADPDQAPRFLCGLSLEMTREQKQQWDKFIKDVLRQGSALLDRRSASRLRNALVFHNPAKQHTHKTSRESHYVQVFQLSPRDLNDLENVEVKAWGKEMCATRDMLKSRLEVFPEGMIGARVHGKLVGYVGLMMIKSKLLHKDFTWQGITDGGFIRSTHDPEGDCLYGVSLSVIPNAPTNVAPILLKAAGKLTVRKALRNIFFGARMPNYHKHYKRFTPGKYIQATSKKGRILDPELALYRQVNCIPIRVIPNYFKDPDSLNYGVLVSFLNPLYEIQKNEYPFFFDRVTIDFT